MSPIRYTTTTSLIGELLLTGDANGLSGIQMEPHGPLPAGAVRDDELFADAIVQLREYFNGDRTSFDVALSPVGTPFQLRVWKTLRRIPYGTTISYGELARRVGNAKAARAVGLANNRNPLPIIVPCHRVIGADGSLTGYGGGLERKRVLLDLEAELDLRGAIRR